MENSENKKIMYLRKVNARDFNPEEFILSYDGRNEFGTYSKKHLPLNIRLAWFWDAYPDGQICFKDEPFIISEGICSSTVELYSDPEKKEKGYYLASAKACGIVGGNEDLGNLVMRIQSQAIANALKRAGFNILIPQEMMDEEEIRSEIESGHTIVLNSLKGKEDMTNRRSGPEEHGSSDDEGGKMAKPMTLTDAMSVLCPFGAKKDRTLGSIMLEDPSFINWISGKLDNYPDVKAAVDLLISEASKISA